MRLWSIHPGYLDSKGLVAVWREGLLALKVLEGRTSAYRNHPQLRRFRAAKSPVGALKCYLWHIFREAADRGYRFDSHKLGRAAKCPILEVTRGQLVYEMCHLKKKLKTRGPGRLKPVKAKERPMVHPSFVVVEGDIEEWEKVQR
jgi:hypothetical protein